MKDTKNIVAEMNEYLELIKKEKKNDIKQEQIKKNFIKEYMRELGYLVVDELIEEIWGGDIEEI